MVRVQNGRRADVIDRAATEEPLEIRLHGKPFAVIMRTPGADRDLAAGFLLAERVLRTPDDLGTIEYCRDQVRSSTGSGRPEPRVEPGKADQVRGKADSAPSRETAENVVNVTLTGGSLADLDRQLADRRKTMTSSACGMCGRLTIESLQADVAPLKIVGSVQSSTVSALPQRLRDAQEVFEETGGLHAAGLFDQDATLIAMAEDIGRHNAVDKVIGRMLMQDELPLSSRLLFVSGRTSFEIVQKALLAGIPIVAAVSAPSSLAIDLALETGITLVGFVRGDSFNIYAHPDRIS